VKKGMFLIKKVGCHSIVVCGSSSSTASIYAALPTMNSIRCEF
jgi:hypothetical protein